jgi:flavin prenyltransferase
VPDGAGVWDMKRIVVGISGATGAIYGIRLLQLLRPMEAVETHLVMTAAARRTLLLETPYSVDDVENLADQVHRSSDIAASIASGSFRTMGMIVAPCSMKTVSGIASSYSDNLLLRAADVTLKERRPLILLVRETPMHLGHLRLLTQVAELNAVVMPPVPAFYQRPTTLDEVIDQTLNRVLDLMGVDLTCDLFRRWEGPDVHPTDRVTSIERSRPSVAKT